MDEDELTKAEMRVVEDAMRAVVERDMEALELMGARPAPDGSRDIYMWTRNYGNAGALTLVMPPDIHGAIYTVMRQTRGAAVDVDVWAEDVGRTDLTLQLELRTSADGSVSATIDDLHAL